jgi:hypothetical protein
VLVETAVDVIVDDAATGNDQGCAGYEGQKTACLELTGQTTGQQKTGYGAERIAVDDARLGQPIVGF